MKIVVIPQQLKAVRIYYAQVFKFRQVLHECARTLAHRHVHTRVLLRILE